MANWQTTIDLTSIWSGGDIKQLSAEISRQLKGLDLSFLDGAKVVPGSRSGLSVVNSEVLKVIAGELAQEFHDLSEESEPDVDDFDDLMESLYDWADHGIGDKKKICWVATLS
jgi:hypothetical protein